MIVQKIYYPPNKKNKSESLIGVGLIVPSNLILKKNMIGSLNLWFCNKNYNNVWYKTLIN